MHFKHKDQYTFDQRSEDSRKIRQRFPDKVPVIVECHPDFQAFADIDKHKFLVPADLTAAQFMWLIRKRINLGPEKALYIYMGSTFPQSSATMGHLYNQLKDKDGFLYACYNGENSFG